MDINYSNKYFIKVFYIFILFINFIPSLSHDLNQNILGQRVKKNSIWVGSKRVLSTMPIVIMAGHADSQNIKGGAGTQGEAVGLKGMTPMESGMTDELFWNLKIRDAVVKLGKKKGLDIISYDPVIRSIVDENNFKTNWSVGAKYAEAGFYVIEIHFDSYGDHGLGSGIIPPLTNNLNSLDESLANTFGRYPLFFRGGLGAARRQIRILEIGKLEGELERNLRNIKTRENTIYQIAFQIIQSIQQGLNNNVSVNQLLQEGDIFLPDSYQ